MFHNWNNVSMLRYCHILMQSCLVSFPVADENWSGKHRAFIVEKSIKTNLLRAGTRIVSIKIDVQPECSLCSCYRFVRLDQSFHIESAVHTSLIHASNWKRNATRWNQYTGCAKFMATHILTWFSNKNEVNWKFIAAAYSQITCK